jgi:uncharacterized membrane protein
MKTQISIEGLHQRVRDSQRGFVTAQSNQATTRKPWKSLAAVAFGLLLSVPGLTQPQLAQAQYSFSTIDVTIHGQRATRTAANGNSTNKIVGEFDDKDGTHGFVLDNGVFTQINAPDAAATVVSGVNALGQLAGFKVAASDGTFHGFFKGNGDFFMPIDPPGSVRTFAFFINAQDQVVGTFRTADQKRHGFIWNEHAKLPFDFTIFNVPGDDFSVLGTSAVGINDIGEVVGTYVDAKGRHGFLRSSEGDFATFDVPGAQLTVAQGINNAGTIVGLYDDGSLTHGFVLKNPVFMTGVLKSGDFKKVDVPGVPGQHTEVYSINAKGEIVGAYFVPDPPNEDVVHGFLGVPVR